MIRFHLLVVFAILAVLGGFQGVLGDEEEHHEEDHHEEIEDDVPVPPMNDLEGMIDYILVDDERLIRYNVPSQLVWLRQEKLCSKYLDGLLKQLTKSYDNEKTIKLVTLIKLCSSEHPEFRQQIGDYNKGAALKFIVSLLDKNDDSLTAAVGDAIWILSFANEANHNYFTEHAIDKMTSIIVNKYEELEAAKDDEDITGPALAVMWMAAALQNLAASYCETDSAHCWWEYEPYDEETDPEGTGEHHGLYLHEDSPVFLDGTAAATKIANASGLAKVLHDLICADPMEEEEHESWASETTIESVREHGVDPRIVTWAVAGLLKNLSMYDGSYQVTIDAKDCLCALTQSQDWLESSKADDALHRLGITHEDCFGHYEEEEDEDYGEYYDAEAYEL